MNKVILVGRTTDDFEVRKGNGKAFVTNSLAINNGKDKKADFINIICFGKIAETCNKYVKKGDMLAVEGSIHTNSKDGKYYTSVLVHTIDLLPNARKKGGNNDEVQF